MSLRNHMPKFFWFPAVFLTVIIFGSLYQSLQLSPEIRDKTSLVELTLDDRVYWDLYNHTTPESGFILLYTPNLKGLKVPHIVRGVPIHVLTQSQIDEKSLSQPVDYYVYERIQERIDRSNSFTAEVEMTFEWQYQVGVFRVDSSSGYTYYCSKKTGQWVIYMTELRIP